MSKTTISHLYKKKEKKEKIVAISAYQYNLVKIIDEFCDIILVGDTLSMLLYGTDTTLSATMSMMINHGKAVVKASKQAFIIIDMPFGSYQQSKENALKNASKIIKESSCNSIKLEGGLEMVDTVKFLSERGILVTAHIGLQPQSVHSYGGYKVQGNNLIEQEKILKEAIALENAGAKLLVIEATKKTLVDKIMKKIKIPVIGIGASDKCDGQILVLDDLLGITDKTAKFCKKYANINQIVKESVKNYSEDIKNRKFPNNSYLY